jgi:zinc protease
MDDLGANNRNGTTSTDRTNFFEDVPVSALERTLYLEADRMGFLAGHISEEMLERERGVVQNEKRQGENQPYGRVFGSVVETIYPYHHPYSWSTIGSMEDLDAASLDDVKEWYADLLRSEQLRCSRWRATSRPSGRASWSKSTSAGSRRDRR